MAMVYDGVPRAVGVSGLEYGRRRFPSFKAQSVDGVRIHRHHAGEKRHHAREKR